MKGTSRQGSSPAGAESEDAADPGGHDDRLGRWERVTWWPMTAAAVVFLVAYTVFVVGDSSPMLTLVTRVLVLTIWAMFAVDYVVRLTIAPGSKWLWFRTHLFDLAVVVLPALRPVRLLDAVARLRVLNRSTGSGLRARLLIYGVGTALLLIWYMSLSVLSVERDAPGASIRSFGDAVWWAFCTVTTVGYGDMVPVTVQGRVLAVILMAGGVVLVGLIVASFASYVQERVTRGHDDRLPATKADIERLTALLERERGTTSSASGATPVE